MTKLLDNEKWDIEPIDLFFSDINLWLIVRMHAHHDKYHYLPWDQCDSPDCKLARFYEAQRGTVSDV